MIKMVDKASLADPQASMWNMYKQHQKGGLLFLRFGPSLNKLPRFMNFDSVFVGDFETLRHLFSLPEMQDRSNNHIIKDLSMEERNVRHNKNLPGVRFARPCMLL